MRRQIDSFRVILSLICAVFIISPVMGYLCTEEMYADYLSHWKRNYEEQKLNEDFQERFSIYCQNRQNIDNKNSQDLGYKLDIYGRWIDRKQLEIKKLVSIEIAPEDIAAQAVPRAVSTDLKKVELLPISKDWRTSGDVSSIKDQGSCGCCWSFTTVGLYESWMMVKGEQEYDLSEEYLLECTSKYTQNVLRQNYNSTCNGGYVDFSGQLARVNGIPSESKYPYIAYTFTGRTFPNTDGICSANQTYMYARDPKVTTFNINRNNSDIVMKTLISTTPVGALIYATTDFQSYSSGIYSGCPSSFADSYSRINHAVVIVGYDSNGNYIIKNSWGTAWGQNGFGIVSKDRDCGLSAFAFTYNSNASPGNGVLYYNQVNMDNPNFGVNMSIFWGFVLILLGLMF